MTYEAYKTMPLFELVDLTLRGPEAKRYQATQALLARLPDEAQGWWSSLNELQRSQVKRLCDENQVQVQAA